MNLIISRGWSVGKISLANLFLIKEKIVEENQDYVNQQIENLQNQNLIKFLAQKDPPINPLRNKLKKTIEEMQEWKRKCKILGEQFLEEIQKVRLSVEMFKNEVLGTHKDMQMRFIDEIIVAHK